MHHWQLNQLAKNLKKGALIAYPTETIWGLGCLPNHNQALLDLAYTKRRDISKGFIILSPNIELCLPFITPLQHKAAIQNITTNPSHPTTWLVDKSDIVSPLLSGDSKKIAIRISPHPFIHDLCALTQLPIVSSSANISSRPSLNSGLLIQKHFKNCIDKVVKGYSEGTGQASRIIDLTSKKRLR